MPEKKQKGQKKAAGPESNAPSRSEAPAQQKTYIAEAICGRRTCLGKVQYLIKWKDYPETVNTWEPLTNFPNFKKEIAKHEALYTKEYERNSAEEAAKKASRKAAKTASQGVPPAQSPTVSGAGGGSVSISETPASVESDAQSESSLSSSNDEAALGKRSRSQHKPRSLLWSAGILVLNRLADKKKTFDCLLCKQAKAAKSILL